MNSGIRGSGTGICLSDKGDAVPMNLLRCHEGIIFEARLAHQILMMRFKQIHGFLALQDDIESGNPAKEMGRDAGEGVKRLKRERLLGSEFWDLNAET